MFPSIIFSGLYIDNIAQLQMMEENLHTHPTNLYQ